MAQSMPARFTMLAKARISHSIPATLALPRRRPRMIDDGYAQWYSDRIWHLLPAVYRSLDVEATPDSPGPLRELVNRIGTQAAVVRRSIDRLGENQSIETCDDWVIPVS